MALTDEERVQIRLYLGYDRRDLTLNSYLDGLSSAELAEVRGLLEQISAIDEKMTGSVQTAGVYERAEEITFRGGEGQGMLALQGTSLVRRLAKFLGVRVLRSPFAAGASSGALLRG